MYNKYCSICLTDVTGCGAKQRASGVASNDATFACTLCPLIIQTMLLCLDEASDSVFGEAICRPQSNRLPASSLGLRCKSVYLLALPLFVGTVEKQCAARLCCQPHWSWCCFSVSLSHLRCFSCNFSTLAPSTRDYRSVHTSTSLIGSPPSRHHTRTPQLQHCSTHINQFQESVSLVA